MTLENLAVSIGAAQATVLVLYCVETWWCKRRGVPFWMDTLAEALEANR